jgi:hypothetical protein
MKIFNKVEFVKFVRSNDELYLNNVGVDSKEDCFEYDMKVVDEVVVENGVYCIEFGSRGEVEFFKVNLSEELIEWKSVSEDENEFRYMRDDIGNDYLDLSFEEECIRMYFVIVKENV